MLQYMTFSRILKVNLVQSLYNNVFFNITPRTKAIWVVTRVISSYEAIGRLLLILLLFLIIATTWHDILFKSGFRFFNREIARVIDFHLMELVIFNDFFETCLI